MVDISETTYMYNSNIHFIFWFNWAWVSIGSGNALVLHTGQAIIQSIALQPMGVMPDVEFRSFSETSSSVKLLGVKIDERLPFDDHTSALCAEASHQISALRRIVEYLTIDNRMSIYDTFIASNFNYFITVWHFLQQPKYI